MVNKVGHNNGTAASFYSPGVLCGQLYNDNWTCRCDVLSVDFNRAPACLCCVLIMMRQLSPQPRSKDAAAARFVNYAFLTDASIKCSYLRAGKSSDRHQRDRRSRSKALAAQRHAYIARSTLTRFNVLRIRSAQSSPRKKREPESVVRCYDAMCWRQTDFA